jgi:hypothetical protein
VAGQLWAVSTQGGLYYSLELSDELRMGVQATNKFRQFCDVRDAHGKKHGQTFTWDTVPMMSRASRLLSETNTIPQGNHVILQGTCTVFEHGFSVPYTEMLESMSKFSVKQPIMKVLKYDAQCDIDCTVWEQFNKTPLRVAATATGDSVSLTTNSTATLTVSQQMSLTNAKSILDTMRGRNIPSYTKGDYYLLARHEGLRRLKNDMEAIHQYTETGLDLIMNGEVGRVAGGLRLVEQTTIPRGGAIDSTTFNPFTDTADAWNATAGPDWAFIFGEDTVTEAIVTPEEIRASIPADFGRSKGVAWYGLFGYAIVHTDVTQARIVKWDSAV